PLQYAEAFSQTVVCREDGGMMDFRRSVDSTPKPDTNMLPRIHSPLIRLSNLFPNRQVYAKCEFLAMSGCFKIRGAVHLLEHLRREGRSRPLVVPSMGNTALGAAEGAKAFGFNMVGVVPTTIARAKDEKLRALDVELLT